MWFLASLSREQCAPGSLWSFLFCFLFPLTNQWSKSVRRNLDAAHGRPFGPNSAKLSNVYALGLFFDEMINTFDPDALIVCGGVLETSKRFQQWFLSEIRAGMPTQREEQAQIPIHVMPDGDTAGARGAALEALKLARQSGLA